VTPRVQIGEGFVGDGVDLAHINTVVGVRDGPAGAAFATALATPSAGHVPFLAVLRPGLAAQPPTLFVTKAAIVDDRHGELTWGAAQAGVAAGVADAVAAGVLDADRVTDLVVIAAVWVNPAAADEHAVQTNNRAATLAALRAGAAGDPPVGDTVDACDATTNPYLGRHRSSGG